MKREQMRGHINQVVIGTRRESHRGTLSTVPTVTDEDKKYIILRIHIELHIHELLIVYVRYIRNDTVYYILYIQYTPSITYTRYMCGSHTFCRVQGHREGMKHHTSIILKLKAHVTD